MFYNYNKIKIHYEKYGNNKTTILILPGWGNTSQTFYNIINNFKNNYTIFILDYPGFGKSPIPNKELSIYNYANLIINFMKDFNIIEPIIIAHSFGGRLTTLLAGYYKIPIKKLILIDIATIKHKKTIKQKIKEKIYKLLKKLSIFIPYNKRKNYLNKLLNIFGSKDYAALPNKMHQTFKNIINEDLKVFLKNINCETLIIWGENDIDTPLKDGIKIQELIKNSAIIIYPKAGHFSYLEYPILTNNIINEFIK